MEQPFTKFLFLSVLAILLTSCGVNSKIRRADRLYKDLAYSKAAEVYKKVLKKDSTNTHAMARTANCFRLTNEYKKSEYWFRKVMNREPDEAVISKISEKVQPPIFDYLEGEIGDSTYLAGDAFSIADIAVTCQFIQMMYAGEKLPEKTHPNITRYITTHIHRDSLKGLINADPFMTLD